MPVCQQQLCCQWSEDGSRYDQLFLGKGFYGVLPGGGLGRSPEPAVAGVHGQEGYGDEKMFEDNELKEWKSGLSSRMRVALVLPVLAGPVLLKV